MLRTKARSQSRGGGACSSLRPGQSAVSSTKNFACARAREHDKSVTASFVASTTERLLAVMDAKHHWAWSALSNGGLSRDQLIAHFRHEYRTYVRDFPVLLARLLGQGPPDDVRAALAENVYEEQTGKLS